MFNFLKKLKKKTNNIKCNKCKDTGKILTPTYIIGKLIMYDEVKCDCKK